MTGPQREPYATRRELDQLTQRMNQFDEHGTRGVAVVQAQLSQVIRDVARLETDMTGRFAEHVRQHDREERKQLSSRRFTVATTVAILMLLVAVIGLLLSSHTG